MQLFALTLDKEIVAARDAIKKTAYYCMECDKPVRLRGGRHRQDHFYHLKPDPGCRQSQKSAEHLQVQLHLLNYLPRGEVVLEKRFPQISRIADAAWETRKIVFEVQCSAITQKEVMARNSDYARLGYQTVWILHDQRYHRRRVSAAEEWLSGKCCYYTDFDDNGQGEIYDRLHHFANAWRRYSSLRTAVDFSSPCKVKGRLCFAGDWHSRLQQGDAAAVEVWRTWREKKKALFPKRSFRPLYELKRWYLNLIGILLENASK